MLRSGWLTTGAKAHALEAAIAKRVGARHALAVNSATAALHLALEAWGIGPGDEVVVPTMTFTSCGEVCAYLGARVVLADVGDDGLLGPDQLGAVATDATRAGIPVHLAGQAVDVDTLRAAAPNGFPRGRGACLPADVRGVPTGRLGDAAASSFYATTSPPRSSRFVELRTAHGTIGTQKRAQPATLEGGKVPTMVLTGARRR